jgi:hypothetical protein
MRTLNTIVRCLVAGLLALTVRALLGGLTFGGELASAVLVVLLLACLDCGAEAADWNRPRNQTGPTDGEGYDRRSGCARNQRIPD